MNSLRLKIGAVHVDRLSMDDALSVFKELMGSPESDGRSRLIVTPNSEIAAASENDPKLLAAIEKADLVIPDGIGLFLAAKRIGEPLPEKLAGIEFCSAAIGLCAENGWKVYLLGGRPGVAEDAAARLEKQFSGLVVCGCKDGYFSEKEEAAVISDISVSGADFLVAGLGSPKQELFLYRNLERLGCRACIGVGGSLDVWAGRLKRAPEWMTRCGLEWLFRLIQEPRRIKRISKIPGFLVRAGKRRA